MTSVLKAGDTIGILGGGQLGRMMALAAARLGLECHIYCPDASSPAFRVAGAHTIAAYDDEAALTRFAQSVDVITYEFENVPARTVQILSQIKPLRPNADALRISQDRVIEKTFLRDAGIAVAPFAAINTLADIPSAIAITGLPAVIKTRRMGYDGKGQAYVRSEDDITTALARFGGTDCILEGRIPFVLECSAIVVRSGSGDVQVYDIGENRHENHILKETIVPARVALSTLGAARDLGVRIATALDYIGVLGVELFLVRKDDGTEQLIVNEIAPRVHNSGHWTEDGAVTSQFENHIRAIAGWPLGSVATRAPTQMINLIGDEASDITGILVDPLARLHLYGKSEARPGRKMGHINYVTPNRDHR